MKTYVHSWYIAELFLKWIVSESCRENWNEFCVQQLSFGNRAVYDKMGEIMVESGHRWQYNKERTLCMLGNWGCKNTLRIRNTYCFSSATMITRMRFNITSCSILAPRSNGFCCRRLGDSMFVRDFKSAVHDHASPLPQSRMDIETISVELKPL
jgi:hypothetical protein